jgi:hypothetical protein
VDEDLLIYESLKNQIHGFNVRRFLSKGFLAPQHSRLQGGGGKEKTIGLFYMVYVFLFVLNKGHQVTFS